MAVQQQQVPQPRHVDLPEMRETFADSIHTMVWDGQTLRLEFSVTRYPEMKRAGEPVEATRHPACRLVLTAAALLDLHNRLQQTVANLVKTGVITQTKTPKEPPQTAS